MQQPALGRRISELRKAKGLTQEELVERCKLSVRTLQRIEAGEVMPRSYTLRTIFSALDIDPSEIADNSNSARLSAWLNFAYRYLLDLFNLKTNTMKKVSVLTVVCVVVTSIFVFFSTDINAQTEKEVRNMMETHNQNFKRWFNNAQTDSIVAYYSKDACLVSLGCGKDFIKQYFRNEVGQYRIEDLQVIEVKINNTMATEKGKWKIALGSGGTLQGDYRAEWKKIGNQWLITEEMNAVSPGIGK